MIRSVDFPRCEFFYFQQRWKRCEMATVSSVIFPGAHKYLQSFRMSIQYPRNICDVSKKKSVYSHHTSPILTSISTYPRVDLALRTDWCVWKLRKYLRGSTIMHGSHTHQSVRNAKSTRGYVLMLVRMGEVRWE